MLVVDCFLPFSGGVVLINHGFNGNFTMVYPEPGNCVTLHCYCFPG